MSRWPKVLIGYDEGDEICDTASADLCNDGTIAIKLSCQDGDDAVLKARRTCILQRH